MSANTGNAKVNKDDSKAGCASIAPHARSSPIAIRKDSSSRPLHSGDFDTSDEDNECDDVPLNTQSMPARLLRAPRLTAVHHASFESSPLERTSAGVPSADLLPPPVIAHDSIPSSTRGGHQTTPYGSLRDSRLAGRFLDGPQSYRDVRTGQYTRPPTRVRFGPQHTHLSIGERIVRNQRAHQNTTPSLPAQSSSSSLAEALSHAQPNVAQEGTGANTNALQRSFYDDDNTPTFGPSSGTLSMSLTGYEMMRDGAVGRLLVEPQRTHAAPSCAEMPAMSRRHRSATSSNGSDGLGPSRSLSDPAPTPLPTGSFDAPWEQPTVQRQTRPTFSQIHTDTDFNDGYNGMGVPRRMHEADSDSSNEGGDHDPDTHGTFDMEL